jgi:hypothetical protein
LLTLAITVVVGLEVGPQFPAHRTSTPAVCSADEKVAEDTVKVAERREPRVLRASFLNRLAPLGTCPNVHAVAGADQALAPHTSTVDGRSAGERRPLVKHVPRMERGDPPRA